MAGVETFIVRIWSPAEGPPAEPALRGKVSHVETGRDGAFVGAEELLDFLSSGQGGDGAGLSPASGVKDAGAGE